MKRSRSSGEISWNRPLYDTFTLEPNPGRDHANSWLAAARAWHLGW
jgi:hypothetical protein